MQDSPARRVLAAGNLSVLHCNGQKEKMSECKE